MIFILLGMVICVLVPLAPLLLIRRALPRPGPPLPESELRRLGEQLHPLPLPPVAEVAPPERGGDVMHPTNHPGAAADVPPIRLPSSATAKRDSHNSQRSQAQTPADDPLTRLSLEKNYQWITRAL